MVTKKQLQYNPQYTPFVSRWNNPLILTIDPNFQRDIEVVFIEIFLNGKDFPVPNPTKKFDLT